MTQCNRCLLCHIVNVAILLFQFVRVLPFFEIISIDTCVEVKSFIITIKCLIHCYHRFDASTFQECFLKIKVIGTNIFDIYVSMEGWSIKNIVTVKSIHNNVNINPSSHKMREDHSLSNQRLSWNNCTNHMYFAFDPQCQSPSLVMC